MAMKPRREELMLKPMGIKCNICGIEILQRKDEATSIRSRCAMCATLIITVTGGGDEDIE